MEALIKPNIDRMSLDELAADVRDSLSAKLVGLVGGDIESYEFFNTILRKMPEEPIIQKYLNQTGQTERLTPQALEALFKHIEEAETEIARHLNLFGFVADSYMELADKLIKGKERFDLVILDKKIESRERYMNGLPKLCEHLKQLHQENDACFRQLSASAPCHRKELEEEFGQNLQALNRHYSRFYYKHRVIENFCEQVDDYQQKFWKFNRRVEADPNDKEFVTKLRDLQQRSWHTTESFNEAYKLLRDWLKVAINTKGVIFRSCQERVSSIAKKYENSGVKLEELIEAGNLGLNDAIAKFEYRRSLNLYNWVYRPIENCIKARVFKMAQESISQQAHGGDSDDLSFGDFIANITADKPPEDAGFTMLKDKIKNVLDTLTEREREMLELRFGLKDGQPRTREEVGRQFSVTPERIRQIEAKTLRKMRHPTRLRKIG